MIIEASAGMICPVPPRPKLKIMPGDVPSSRLPVSSHGANGTAALEKRTIPCRQTGTRASADALRTELGALLRA